MDILSRYILEVDADDSPCVPVDRVYTMQYVPMSWVRSSSKVKGQRRVLHAVPDVLLQEVTSTWKLVREVRLKACSSASQSEKPEAPLLHVSSPLSDSPSLLLPSIKQASLACRISLQDHAYTFLSQEHELARHSTRYLRKARYTSYSLCAANANLPWCVSRPTFLGGSCSSS